MTRASIVRGSCVCLLSLATFFLGAVVCRAQAPPRTRDGLREPVYRVAKAKDRVQPASAEVREHPLMPAIRLANEGLERIRKGIKDYSCTIVKRERIDGKLGDYQYMFAKVRQEQRDENGRVTAPFSVYMYFLKPENIKGREVIWVKGRNDGKMIAHEGGPIMSLITGVIDPNGAIAMRGQLYPITEIGIENLIVKLLERAEADTKYGECEVKFFEGSKINGRVCTCIQVVHPVPRKNFRFYLARIFFDDELRIPVRYESYTWPKTKGGKPLLLEEYTYLNMKINNGFTDADFDRNNPKYNFN